MTSHLLWREATIVNRDLVYLSNESPVGRVWINLTDKNLYVITERNRVGLLRRQLPVDPQHLPILFLLCNNMLPDPSLIRLRSEHIGNTNRLFRPK